MLKLKNEIKNEDLKDLYYKSLITECGYYVGQNKIYRDIMYKKLLSKDLGNLDELIVFHLFMEFMVNRFMGSFSRDIYDYVDEYFEEDLVQFIEEYFKEEGR